VWRAVAEAGEGAVVRLSAAADGADVLLAVERPPGAAAPGLGWVAEVAAAAARSLGGGLEEPEGAGGRRVVLRLPGEAR
jgi:hypothetical protein